MAAPSSSPGGDGAFTVELWDRAPRTRCYRCGRTKLAGLCHECGRAMCEEHLPQPGRFRTNYEFEGLHLDRTPMGDEPLHCTFCRHDSLDLLQVLLIIALISVAFLLSLLWLFLRPGGATGASSLPLYLLGYFVLLALLVLTVFNYVRTLRRPTALPLHGSEMALVIKEKVAGAVSLSREGKYEAEMEELSGELAVSLPLASQDEERFRRFGGRLQRSAPSGFHAGFARIDGPALLTLDPDVRQARATNTVVLTGDNTLTDLFHDESYRWQERFGYSFSLTGRPLPFPVEIIPSLMQEGERCALELVVQLADDKRLRDPQMAVRVEQLDLYTPVELGLPEVWRPPADIGAARPKTSAPVSG